MSDNPQTIMYAQEAPKQNCRACQGLNIINLTTDKNVREVKVFSDDPEIDVQNLSDTHYWKYKLSLSKYENLSGSIALIASIGGIAQTLPLLLGQIVDTVTLNWELSKAVISQSINVSGISLAINDRSLILNGQSINSDQTFTITSDDGQGKEGSTINLSASIQFGNYYFYGHGSTLLGKTSASAKSQIEALGKVKATSKSKNIYATGGANEHFIIAYPKRFGLLTKVKKGLLEGGFIRLKNVNNTLVSDLNGMTETDITVSNGITSEAYYIYQSAFDNQVDTSTPIEFT